MRRKLDEIRKEEVTGREKKGQGEEKERKIKVIYL